jgi:4'-phosphopantetheinyl transferase
VHDSAREQFIVARGSMRKILASYLNTQPEKVRFAAKGNGKPILGGGEFHFNLSHSKGLALLALSATEELGVDVEQVRPYPIHLELAERYFTPSEVAALRSLPAGQSEKAFFQLWTRKEAFLKAVGLGLAGGLERFEVSVGPSQPARILHIDGKVEEGQRWTLHEVEEGQYVGTIAVARHEMRVVRFAGSEGL